MFPLTFSLIIALALSQEGSKPASTGSGTSTPSSTSTPSTSTPSTPTQGDKGKARPAVPAQVQSWEALKKRIDERLGKDHERLKEVLKPYLSDLALDGKDPKNQKYLEGRYDEIAALDPDIGLVLLPLLSPKGNNRRSRILATNTMLVLEKTSLTPLEGELLSILEKDRGLPRNRALYLLTGFKKSGLDKILQNLLKDTPEVLLPGIIEAIGRYGQNSLVKPLEPFLLKPDEKQRVAAFKALCRIGSAESLGPLVASAKKSNQASDRRRLIHFLETLGNRPGKDGWKKDEAVYFDTLTWLLSQGEALRPTEIQELLKLVQALPAEAGKARGGEKLTQALGRLLTNPYPNVQFGAALGLRHLGHKEGVKQVLDRLTRFVKSNPKLSYAYRQRGRANEAFGEVTDALRDYKRAISLSAGRVDPLLYFSVARLEAKKGNASSVHRYLKEAQPTRQELDRFRKRVPDVEALIRRSNQLRKLFENS